MKVFISQPMNGLANDEIIANRNSIMNEIKELFPDKEIEFLSSFIANAPHDAKPLWYLGRSIQIMSEADVVAFGAGWTAARGCRIEHSVAEEYGKVIVICGGN